MVNHAGMKLGSVPSPKEALAKAIKFEAYLPDTLPEPADDINWGQDVDVGSMLLNDQIGCCTVSGFAHARQIIERWINGVSRQPSDQDVIPNYKAVNPAFNPSDPNTDNGAALSDVMQHWYTNGFTYLGQTDKIIGFARVDPKNEQHVRIALDLGGPIMLGIALPINAQTQDVWPTPTELTGDAAPSSWGLHCVVLKRWVKGKSVEFATWGQTKVATVGWFQAYTEEVWMPIHPLWASAGATSPSGYILKDILKDMNQIKI